MQIPTIIANIKDNSKATKMTIILVGEPDRFRWYRPFLSGQRYQDPVEGIPPAKDTEEARRKLEHHFPASEIEYEGFDDYRARLEQEDS